MNWIWKSIQECLYLSQFHPQQLSSALNVLLQIESHECSIHRGESTTTTTTTPHCLIDQCTAAFEDAARVGILQRHETTTTEDVMTALMNQGTSCLMDLSIVKEDLVPIVQSVLQVDVYGIYSTIVHLYLEEQVRDSSSSSSSIYSIYPSLSLHVL